MTNDQHDMGRFTQRVVAIAEAVWTEDEPTLAEYELTQAILDVAFGEIHSGCGGAVSALAKQWHDARWTYWREAGEELQDAIDDDVRRARNIDADVNGLLNEACVYLDESDRAVNADSPGVHAFVSTDSIRKILQSPPDVEGVLVGTTVTANTWQSAARRLADENRELRAAKHQAADRMAKLLAGHDGPHWCQTDDRQPEVFAESKGSPWPCPTLRDFGSVES